LDSTFIGVMKKIIKLLCIFAIALLSIKARAETITHEVDIALKLGAEYNSNISIEELDLNSSVSGTLANIELLTEYRYNLSDTTSFRLGYDFSQTLHQDLTEFNFQSHGVSAGFENQFSDLTTSIDYSYYDTKLDDEGLLSIAIFTPAISYMLNNNLLVRFDYNFIEKEFNEFFVRNAETNKSTISAYYFFNGAKSYAKISLSDSKEDADSRQLDFEESIINMSIKLSADWLHNGSAFKAGYTYSDRDYDDITLSINAVRAEQKNQFTASFTIPYSKGIDLIAAYENTDRSSNLTFADYQENRLMLSVLLSW
jgi:hypothetical protein